ncbi:ead/Ea22-like family protein [Salmonella enterica]|uniref:Ead/Ea22-like family protein n=1 Tax=Salmonella enterica TaxID=28901 RepID=A0A5U0TFX0_SALER|nr:ead/Ea22-like family protein [Salmonella enterica]EBS9906616.1 ead/Ea22-like family protein [Salmonella enterica subsp. enterica serovar Mississippi]EDM7276812.1 ead/Ea22-like family protein [Salmonella enterica subsp. enterica serovar Enteritidis]EDT1540782.1 ead/Ea22-like family protein [Salmonella enterica subsp. enterica serovar Javiana]EDU5312853.1 ead/Ea22-like family protein [Salmonella enterica subsp. enterica]EHF1403561.1 ead/Ea22-like family protein [Salmonella enterica subsp. ent
MNIDKQALRESYSPKPVPKCHICGEEMTIQRISASRITYGCTGATYDDKGCHYAEGRSIADDHYEQSRVTVVDVSGPDVLALLDENLQLQREKDAIEAVALALRDDMRQAREQLEAAERRMAEQSAIVAAAEKLVRCKGRYHSELNYRALATLFGVITPDLPPLEHENVHYAEAAEVEISALRQRIAELEKGHQEAAKQINSWRSLAKQNIAERGKDISELEAARQRIAELEAREVTLPAEKFCPSEYAGSQYWEETEVWNKAISACAVAVGAAGIKVKGE